MTEQSNPKYRVGVIGCGRKGTVHARSYALNPLSKIVAGADTDPETLKLFCKRFGVPGYSDYREMIQKEKIDIAAPILPVQANPEVVIECARLGVHAICSEKPMAASLEEADRMVEECQSRGVKFGVGDLDRNIDHYWKAKAVVDSGEMGEILSINVLLGSGAELVGGGIQPLSVSRLFAGDSDVAWLIGWMDGDPWNDYDQGGAGYIRFVNGIECFLHRRSSAKNGYEVLLEGGVIRSDMAYVSVWKKVGDSDRFARTQLVKVEGAVPNTHLYDGSGTYDEEGWRVFPRQNATIQSMVDSLELDIEPRSNGDNGRKVLEIAIGLRESHRSGHVPVRLPLPDRSLRMIPSASRYYSKKAQMGAERYAEAMRVHKKE